jgi:hypothetical protein
MRGEKRHFTSKTSKNNSSRQVADYMFRLYPHALMETEKEISISHLSEIERYRQLMKRMITFDRIAYEK